MSHFSRDTSTANADAGTVAGFGREWSYFDQSGATREELQTIFESYFRLFPWQKLPKDAAGFDFGCGSGRWAQFVAGRVKILHCIDASEEALAVAKANLGNVTNCRFQIATAETMAISPSSLDFGYSLGVLHHIPDTYSALAACVSKLKPSAPFLLYMYYAFDQRPWWFRALWRASDVIRGVVSRVPFRLRLVVSQLIAALIYWPLARTARILEKAGASVEAFPLSFYRNRSFYTMRTDALDRFGTRLERRFTRSQIRQMMESAGLIEISFSDQPPYWAAIGFKRS